jgi:glycosyl hydrolase family 10
MKSDRRNMNRRTFLGAALAGTGTLASLRAQAGQASAPGITLSPAHAAAVNRKRRIVVQLDAHTHMGMDIDQWLAYRFNFADEPGTQIDSLWWDIGALGYAVYPSKVLEQFKHEGLVKWWDQGIDWVQKSLDACKKRKIEAFWHHRICEVEMVTKGVGGDRNTPHPLKLAHPDWVLKTWWKHGLLNLAVPEVRDYKLRVLREVAENYDFDGMQLDFARHIPCLPPGRQWELRDNVTDLMRRVRLMLLEVEKKRGRPFLLAAKVPRNLEGCRVDGFDVEQWAKEGLVDIFTLGSRSINVDVAAYREITAGRNIKLQPCFDDHHTSDAYQYPPIELFRGVFGNWWQQGADSAYTFNWSNAVPEVCKSVGALPGPDSQRQAYLEVGSPETLRFKDKIFPVERRYGYEWAEGYFGRNDTAPLPAMLSNEGEVTALSIRVCDDLAAHVDKVNRVSLRLILFAANTDDVIEAQVNGTSVPLAVTDTEWKDKLIRSPRPQPNSGGADYIKVNPKQRLLRLDYTVDPALCKVGENQVQVRVKSRATAQAASQVKLEKLELHVQYHSKEKST